MDLNVRLNFHEEGFTPGTDILEKDLEVLQEQFLNMYNLWAKVVNAAQDRINDTWQEYETIKEANNELVTFMAQMTMGIADNMDYYDWCEKWYKDAAKRVDLIYTNTRLRGRIFRDGECPIYGVTFVDHPEWLMYFTVELV